MSPEDNPARPASEPPFPASDRSAPTLRAAGLWRRILTAMLASRLLRLAVLISIIGLAMWIYAAATRPNGAEAAGLSDVALAVSHADGAATRRAIDASAPATFRFGFSFVVGFVVGWCARHLLRVTLLVAGGIAVVVVLLHKLGFAGADWSAVKETADHSVAWVKDESQAVGNFITGYVPSALTAGLGVFWGFRRR